MTDSDTTLALSTPPDDIDTVQDFVQRVLEPHSDIVDIDRFAFETALVELASNVIQHAAAGTGITCVLSIHADDHELSARISDTGTAGAVTLSGPVLPDDLAESGRGLALIQMLVDSVHFERVGDRNVWTISRARHPLP
ncbi:MULTISPECIES: ATP-binding protein [Cryobacterium]|uniref:ATP-binding protein n=1 Tax=Cryobacterium TaxID=69578 RepID=UPI00141A9877|nr:MULTISPECIES: ATP-binding protein [Cryobacterium]